jgi:ABC-type glycerol-3-phosphate transport system substrate-binding protein
VKPFAGLRLRVAGADGPAQLLLERHGRAWERASGATVERTAEAATADVVMFAPPQLGRLVADNRLRPLPRAVTESGRWGGFLRLYRNRLLLWGDAAYALPMLGDATVVIYRADVYAAAGRPPPQSFPMMREQARQFAAERGRPSVPPLAGDDRLDREFYSAAAAFGVQPVAENELKDRPRNDPTIAGLFAFHFDVATGEPRIAGPGFVAALDWLRALEPHRSRQAGAVAAWEADEAVVGLGTLADLAALKPAEHPGRYGVAPIPAGNGGEHIPYAGPGGLLAGVAAGSQSAEAAVELLQYLSSPQVGLEVVHQPAFASAPFRGTQLADRRDGWFRYGLDAAGTDRLRDALAAAVDPRVVNAPSSLRVPRAAEYEAALTAGVRTALAGAEPPATALAGVAARWAELDAARPAAERLADYLRSLCLRR